MSYVIYFIVVEIVMNSCDNYTNENILGYTVFVSGSSNIDPRSGDWSVADIYLNTKYSQSSLRSGIVAHEIGHALGLDHRDADTGSLMYKNIANMSRNVPAAVDVTNLKHIY